LEIGNLKAECRNTRRLLGLCWFEQRGSKDSKGGRKAESCAAEGNWPVIAGNEVANWES